jgi:hypothetical protein
MDIGNTFCYINGSDKVYQLLAHGRWFSLGIPASSTTKTGHHGIAEILLKVASKHQKSNQIKSNLFLFVLFLCIFSFFFCILIKYPCNTVFSCVMIKMPEYRLIRNCSTHKKTTVNIRRSILLCSVGEMYFGKTINITRPTI